MGLGNNLGFGSKGKSSGGGGSDAFNGNRPITLQGIPNFTGKILGGTTIREFLEGFFPALAPGASLIVANNATRLYGASNQVTLNWTATRNTNPITSIEVNGETITPTGETQNGVVSAEATQNADTTFYMSVSAGSQNVLASATVQWRHYRWWFLSSTDLFNQSDAQISQFLNTLPGGTFEFATDRNQPLRTFNANNQFIYFGHLANYGTPTFVVNGLANNAYTFKDIQYTNPYGFISTLKLSRSGNILTGTYNVDIN